MSQLKRNFLKCKISNGMFEDERAVKLDIKGKIYMTIADKEDVRTETAIHGNNWVGGLLRVYNVENRGDKAFVILPNEAAGHGRRLLVPRRLLRTVQ